MLADHIIEIHAVSQRQAGRVAGIPRTTVQYEKKPKADQEIIEQLQALTAKHPSIGFWQSFHRLRRKGYTWNHKRVYRVYTAMRLNIRRRHKKRLPARVKQALFAPEAIRKELLSLCV